MREVKGSHTTQYEEDSEADDRERSGTSIIPTRKSLHEKKLLYATPNSQQYNTKYNNKMCITTGVTVFFMYERHNSIPNSDSCKCMFRIKICRSEDHKKCSLA